MSKSVRRLGRGLDSLVSNLRIDAPIGESGRPGRPSVPENIRQPEDALSAHPDGSSVTAIMIEPSLLEPNPFQPRNTITNDEVLRLAESIRHSGLLQPLTARLVSGRYQLITGERRWRAVQSLGMRHVPVIVREASDEQMLELALIENIQREDLNPIDRANAYQRFCTRFGLRPEDVAQRVSEDRTTVVNYIRLLDLPESLQALVAAGQLSMGHARCLLGVKESSRRQELAESVARNELSVRALEELVRREKTRGSVTGHGSAEPPDSSRLNRPHIRDMERRFEEALKTKVSIHEGKRKGTGRITIEYYSFDDFERVAAALDVRLE